MDDNKRSQYEHSRLRSRLRQTGANPLAGTARG
jgi:hypothetical protein